MIGMIYKYIYKDKSCELPEDFTITAHAGSNDTEDNTIPSLKVAAVSGADVVEFDLNVDENGQPVLSHNKPKGGEPLFEDALKLIAGYEGIRINIDVKDTSMLDKVQKIVVENNMLERVFYTGVFPKYVPAVKEKSPLIPYYINCDPNVVGLSKEEYCQKLTDEVIALGGIGVNIQFLGALPELLKACREKGLLLSIWTVNNEDDMRNFLLIGPDNITTEKPTMLRNILEGNL